MRALTSTVLAALLVVLVGAEGFGRFGYRTTPELPGLSLDMTGFRSKSPQADKFEFAAPARQWKLAAASAEGQTVLLNAQALGPQKARYNLWQPGASLYFEKGMQFKVASTGCPYLTWSDGTVGEGVPTPETSWVLISFRTPQPPILLVLESGKAGFHFTGKAGAWVLKTETRFQGWMRVIQPLGTSEVAANSAASLGQLNQRVFENVTIWTQPAPILQNLEVKGDATSVEATWTFDRPGAIVPLGAALASVGGYPVRIQSKIRRLSDWNEEGPIAVCEEPTLKIRFPIRRIPLGRSLTLGKREIAPIGTVSPIDIPSVVELALENLLADRDLPTYQAADDTFTNYLNEAVYTQEPITQQSLPYTDKGVGIDLAACHALLMQAISIGRQASSEANSLLTSVAWRRDAYSWQLAVPDPAIRRRAEALAAIAGVLCSEPERSLEAAMFEAGLAAERGLATLRSRKANQPEPTFSEPLDDLRQFAFFRDTRQADESAFGKALLSEIRVFGDASLYLLRVGEAITGQWTATDVNAHQIILASAYPIDFELGNMKTLEIERALGLTQVRYVAYQPGPCFANLRRPEWAKDLPESAKVPRYSEPLK